MFHVRAELAPDERVLIDEAATSVTVPDPPGPVLHWKKLLKEAPVDAPPTLLIVDEKGMFWLTVPDVGDGELAVRSGELGPVTFTVAVREVFPDALLQVIS